MRAKKFQGTAGYVTRMSGGVGGGGREAFEAAKQWVMNRTRFV